MSEVDSTTEARLPLPRRVKDLRGKKFHMLLVQEYAGIIGGRVCFQCLCDCGKTKVVPGGKMGVIKSCGCHPKYYDPNVFKPKTTHGMRRSPLYGIWRAMKDRCNLPSVKTYATYGGRGIKVCARWQTSFENFYADMGDRPSSKHSLDRIDTNGNYDPDNCRWATSVEQNRNRRDNVIILYRGERKTLAEWRLEFSISEHRFRTLRKSGVSVDEAWASSVISEKHGYAGHFSVTPKE
jgi:hypothetical protein